ncbi:uncharacterized protein N7484_006927 [Penicillium longicatenatum]|uniref:uncharacterized protein n=1 Tax=Penicillium longicatenatum TaxID=1561947 RepID=UPI00254765D9|nr:uncharacterized protein N7484_006927 [Penicillium longicatenatum]KAJ5639065.1 hypothetical protein N7484_006927 [Penicillium longicatenatum]
MATSIISRGSEGLDVFARRSTPKIEIDLEGQKPGLVTSYTTGDYIEGIAKITVDHETRFDEIEIVLQGTSHTTVERAACPGRTGSQQMFLKLRQPIEDTDYPTPRVLEAGRTYSFPFTFVVPARLLPQVCMHAKKNNHIHRSHTMLPPTLGDSMVSADGKTLIDDMAPDMSQIAYIVRVTVLKRSGHHESKTLANVAKKVRIIPTVEEEPPLNTVDHTNYCTRKEKTVKRGFLRGKQGQLVAAALQPKPICLLPPSCETHDTVSTVAKVQLRFDPVGNEQPPRLGSMTSKIRASTYYSANPWEDFPCQSGALVAQVGQGLYTDTVSLSSMCVASAKWEKHSSSERRDSVNSASSSSTDSSVDSTGPSASFTGDTYYTASLVVPVSLPSSKTFVPTFHSCLMSRTYSLDCSLSYHTPGANVLTPTISLRLPIQVITQPKYTESTKSELGLVVTQEELDEFFRPRSMNLASNLVVDLAAPPGYEARSRPRRSAQVTQ